MKSLAEVEKSQGIDSNEYDELIAASLAKLQVLKARLAKVTKQKTMLDDTVAKLKRTHVRQLLRTVVSEPAAQVVEQQKSSLEDLLDREVPVDSKEQR